MKMSIADVGIVAEEEFLKVRKTLEKTEIQKEQIKTDRKSVV